MTQLLLDFSAGDVFAASQRFSTPERFSPPQKKSSSAGVHNASRGSSIPLTSLPLLDAGRQELQHLGQLAQQVVARYDIVRRRREARLAREAQRAREARLAREPRHSREAAMRGTQGTPAAYLRSLTACSAIK